MISVGEGLSVKKCYCGLTIRNGSPTFHGVRRTSPRLMGSTSPTHAMYYAIVRMFDDFSDWEIIDGYDDEPSAEEAAEHYSERFPHALIDVQPVYN